MLFLTYDISISRKDGINMEWKIENAINKSFWHVTTKDKQLLISKSGINQSDDGNLGDGVYCVETGDINSLKSVLGLESFSDNGYKLKDLILIEFQYSGDYQIFKPLMRSYNNEIWIVIKNNISYSEIVKIIDAKNMV